jgi:phosphate acetyltransferase
MNLLKSIKENAKKYQQRIVLPESFEERTIQAADIILAEKLAKIILIGNPDKLKEFAAKFNLNHIDEATIVDPENNPKSEEYINLMLELRKLKD